MKPTLFSLHLLVAMLLAVQSAAAQHLTVAPGAWSNENVWQGGSIPAPDGSVIIQHPITVDGDIAIGPSGNSESTAISVLPGGSLTLASDRTLTVRGNLILNDTQLNLEEGSRLMFDASLSPSPAGTRYRLQIGAADNQSARLNAYCSNHSRCEITSHTANGAGHAFITNAGHAGGGLISGEFLDFVRIGDEQNPAINFSLSHNSSFLLKNSSFDSSGMINSATALSPDGSLELINVVWQNTLSQFSLILAAHEPLTGGTRRIRGCAFDKMVRFYPPVDLTIEDNFFSNAFDVTAGRWRSFRNNFVRSTFQPAIRVPGDIIANYWFVDNPEVENPHFVQALSYDGDLNIEQNIYELNGSDADGDCILFGSPGIPSLATLKGNLVLPNAAGDSSCTLFSALGNENLSLIVENNTYIMGSQGAAVGETYPGHMDMVLSFRSNLAWDDIPRGYKLYDSPPNNNVPDLVRAQNADFNGGFNYLPGSNGRGYHNLEFTSGLPGQNDIDADPQFFDKHRNLSSWSAHIGMPSGVGEALGILSASGPEGLRGQQITGLRRYIQDGFRPSNSAYLGSSHNGEDVGAVQPENYAAYGRPDIQLRARWRNILRGRPVIRTTCVPPEIEEEPHFEYIINRPRRVRIRTSDNHRIRVRAASLRRMRRISISCRYILPDRSEVSEPSMEKEISRNDARRLRLRRQARLSL